MRVLYKNMKCSFMSHTLVFLGFVISSKGVEVDPDKVKVSREWPVPSPLNEICGFHDLATFYRCFILNLSTIVVPITNCMKGGQFIWTMAASRAYEEIKKIMTEPLVLRWLVDASHVGIGGVWSRRPPHWLFQLEFK